RHFLHPFLAASVASSSPFSVGVVSSSLFSAESVASSNLVSVILNISWFQKRLNENNEVFSLSMGEMGTVILGARESCKFFHDRIKGKRSNTKLKKIFSENLCE
ncbi:hypothetical protein S245_038965, partial [Arachis hypogaea]